MPTVKQKKLAKEIVENMALNKPKTAGELLESAGYGVGTQKGSPGRTLEQKGVQEALEELGFTEENAMRVVSEIMLDSAKDANARLKATDQVFKVKGSYAPEKSLNVNLNVNSEARAKSREAINEFLGESAKRFNVEK